jgi:signal peptidase II
MDFLVISFLVVLADSLTKMLVVNTMQEGMSIPVIKGIFNFTYILNSGAAFGMLEHNRTFFIALTVAVLVIAFVARKQILSEPAWFKYGMALFLGGAIGNLIDRIATGLVVDFFDFIIWPVFNVADIAICVGVGMIIWSILKSETKMKKS